MWQSGEGTRLGREVDISFWLRGMDLNHQPLGYEPNELPDCSTPHNYFSAGFLARQTPASAFRRHRFDLSFFECRVKPRPQCHADQCCDEDRGVQLPDEGFGRGQRSGNAMDWIRVTERYGREGLKAKADQTSWFACGNPHGEGCLEVDCVGNLFD